MRSFSLAIIAVMVMGDASAANIIRTQAPITYNQDASTWSAYAPLVSQWADSGQTDVCGPWSPDPSTIEKDVSFTQSSDCVYTTSRTVQAREKNATTGVIRNVGPQTQESGTVTHAKTQQSIGTALFWSPSTPLISDWVEASSPTSCTTWLPSADDAQQGQTITQTADCTYATTRSTQQREVNSQTGVVRNVGVATVESSTVTRKATQEATGTGANFTATYQLTVGKFTKPGKSYFGHMSAALASKYAIAQTTAGSITENGVAAMYKSYPISAVYFANDGSNVLVFAYPEEAPDTYTVPIVSINGVACTWKATYRQNSGFDLFYFNSCGSQMDNKTGTVFTVTVK